MESNLLMAWQPGIDLANGATGHASAVSAQYLCFTILLRGTEVPKSSRQVIFLVLLFVVVAV